MSVTKNKLSDCQTELTITVPYADLTAYLDKACAKLSKDMKVEGFRPGKVPYHIMKAQVGELIILEEAARELINRTAGKIIEAEVSLDYIGTPDLKISKLAPDNDLEYKVTVETLPKVELKTYQGFAIKAESAKLDEAEITKSLEQLKEMQVKEELVDREAIDGDKLTVNIKMFLDNVPVDGGQGTGVAVIIGKNYVVPGFDKELIGLVKGATKEFKLPYPADHHQRNLAGKMVEFSVTVLDVFSRTMPEIDDDFAIKLGLKDAEDLKAKVSEGLLAEKTKKADEKTEIAILEQLVNANPIATLPESLVHSEAHQMVHELEHNVEHMGGKFADYLTSINKTHDSLVTEFKAEAEKRIKVALLMKELAVFEKMEVSEEEIDAELETLKGHYHGQADALAHITKPEFRRELRGRILNRQIIEKLKEWNLIK
jgi:trigger factor